jgi:hypothetical protein
MDPQLMIDLSKTYRDSSGRPAPFDWRSPFPHAIYWASVGVQKLNAFEGRMRKTASEFGFKVPMRGSRGLGDPFGAEPLYEFQRGQLERIIYVAMQSLVNHGRILFDMNGNIMLDNGPDYRFADAALPLYEKYINSMDERYASGARDGFQNFLTNGVVQFSVNGDNAKAQQYYKLLCQNFPDAVKPYKSYDAFLEDQFRLYTSAMTFSACRNLVRAYVNSALIAASLGDDEDAVALENEGKKLADHWVDRENNNLRGLIDYEAIKNSAIVELFTGKMQMAPQQLQLLKKRIGETAIDRIVKAATEGAKKAPTTEKASAQMQQNNTIKPDLDAPQYH